jgi:hypothetical protein
MDGKCKKISRRNFIKAAGVAGIGSALGGLSSLTRARGSSLSNELEHKTVPTRPFGKTGVNVSILSLGCELSASDLLVFRQAFKMGVTYWDTADSYGGGKNEKAIGKYFTKFPKDRKKVFLVTKAGTSDPKKLTEKLNASLERMNTTYIDLYFIHYVSNVKKEGSSRISGKTLLRKHLQFKILKVSIPKCSTNNISDGSI